MRDPWARHRELLHEGISRCLDGAPSSSSQLVREQIDASDAAEYEPAALVCLAAAEAVGSSPEAAVSGAVSMAFLSQMAIVFTSLENSGGAPSLSTAWGMPRSLNAGDAMFAFAQESIFSGQDELTAGERLRALAILDRGSRALVDFFHAWETGAGEMGVGATGTLDTKGVGRDAVVVAQRSLFPTAMSLGALLAGADDAHCERLEELGMQWATMPEEQLSHALASDPAGWLAT